MNDARKWKAVTAFLLLVFLVCSFFAWLQATRFVDDPPRINLRNSTIKPPSSTPQNHLEGDQSPEADAHQVAPLPSLTADCTLSFGLRRLY